MTYVALVILIMLVQYQYFGMVVGQARGKTGIKAPAMTGDPYFERCVRVHLNTAEQLIAVIPATWLCAAYFRADVAAVLGGLYVIGRFAYAAGYYKDGNRSAGMIIGFLALLAMLILGLYGTITTLI